MHGKAVLVTAFESWFYSLQDPDLSRLLCRLKFVSKLGIASPDVTYCESLKVCVTASRSLTLSTH